MPTLSFGQKEFTAGLSPIQGTQGILGGFFSQQTAIDVYRKPGVLAPGTDSLVQARFEITGAVPNFLATVMGGLDPSNFFYAMSSTKLYRVGTGGTILNSGVWPHTLSGGTSNNIGGHSVVTYVVNGTTYTFAFTDDDIIRYDYISIVDPWCSSSGGPANFAKLNAFIHRAVEFNSVLYFTNGNYVGYLDGTVGSTGTLNTTKLQLPYGFTAYDIQIVSGVLEVYTSGMGKSAVITWDGVATLPTDITYINEKKIGAGEVVEGFPHLLTSGRTPSVAIRQKNFYGYPAVAHVLPPNFSTPISFDANTVAVGNGMLILGDKNSGKIWTYGTPYPQYSYRDDTSQIFPSVLNSPLQTQGTTLGSLYVINEQVWTSSSVSGNFYFYSYPYVDVPGNTITFTTSSTPSFKSNFVPLPNDSSIESIRVYVLPSLVPNSGPTCTIRLYTDYSTTATQTFTFDPSQLDANGKSKTFLGIGALADSVAIGGDLGSNGADATQITRIEVNYGPAPK